MAIKRAIFFTIDSLLASGILIIVVLLVSNFYLAEQQRTNINYASQDLVRVFSTMTVGEVNNDYVKNLTASKTITNSNNTILEQIGEFWSKNENDVARNMSKELIESLIPKQFGVSVMQISRIKSGENWGSVKI